MYGAVATTDEAMKIHSAWTKDNVQDSKILYEIVYEISFDDPFRTAAVKWRLYDERDYVSLDATGIINRQSREQVVYSISHSAALSDVPSFESSHGIERGNISVCADKRHQRLSSAMCAAFSTSRRKMMFSRIYRSRQSPLSGQLMCGRVFVPWPKSCLGKFAKNCGWSSRSARTYSFADDLDDFVVPNRRHQPPAPYVTRCAVCNRASSFRQCI